MLFFRAVFNIELALNAFADISASRSSSGGGAFRRQDAVETGLETKKAARSEEPIVTPDGGELVRYRDCPF